MKKPRLTRAERTAYCRGYNAGLKKGREEVRKAVDPIGKFDAASFMRLHDRITKRKAELGRDQAQG